MVRWRWMSSGFFDGDALSCRGGEGVVVVLTKVVMCWLWSQIVTNKFGSM